MRVNRSRPTRSVPSRCRAIPAALLKLAKSTTAPACSGNGVMKSAKIADSDDDARPAPGRAATAGCAAGWRGAVLRHEERADPSACRPSAPFPPPNRADARIDGRPTQKVERMHGYDDQGKDIAEMISTVPMMALRSLRRITATP